MKLRAIGHRVLIAVDEVKEEKVGGIIIARTTPKEALEMGTDTGTIVQIGSQVDRVYLEGASIGDKVVFSRHEGCAKCFDGVLYRVLPDACIWAVITEK
jgi:co-chaperonin GroES (HSP10)